MSKPTPISPNDDLARLQRFVELDGGIVVQIEYFDTGNVTADGTPIWRQHVSSGPPAGAAVIDISKTVTAPATPEALHSDTEVLHSVVIQAKESNLGWVKIGNATSQSLRLESGDSVRYFVDNLNKLFCDVELANEGVNISGS